MKFLAGEGVLKDMTEKIIGEERKVVDCGVKLNWKYAVIESLILAWFAVPDLYKKRNVV